ncbi:MAG: lipid A-modifier LpxR family protein [Pseudohongiellaceae bacterium]
MTPVLKKRVLGTPGLGLLLCSQVLWAQSEDQWTASFFFENARAVAYTIFLDGNTFRDSHSVEKRHFVTDMAVGVAVVRERWRLSYAHVYRSREFETQQRAQKYGALSLSYSYPW